MTEYTAQQLDRIATSYAKSCKGTGPVTWAVGALPDGTGCLAVKYVLNGRPWGGRVRLSEAGKLL